MFQMEFSYNTVNAHVMKSTLEAKLILHVYCESVQATEKLMLKF